MGPIASNCYIVGSEATKEGMIIDPGADAGEIMKNVRKLGLKVKIIVLTHQHLDHVGAAGQVKEATGAGLPRTLKLPGICLSLPATSSSHPTRPHPIPTVSSKMAIALT